jgi:outer membrane lipoprotein-sorting protein
MNNAARLRTTLILLAAMLPLSGCLFRTHKVEQHISSAPLKTATRNQLVNWVNEKSNRVQTMNATVDIAADVGGSKKGKVTEYQEIRGYILMRRPDMLRMIGLMPIVRNRAFDMVSNGQSFELWIPPKNKFYVGNNNEPAVPSANALENLRPKVIYDALLLHPINGPDQIAVLESGLETVTDKKTKKTVQQPDYELLVIQRGVDGWYLARKYVFDRADLLLDRQIIFDQNGNVATDVRYADVKDYGGIKFPSTLQINRPQEEYEITIGIVKATFNQPVTDEQFSLTRPPGSQLIRLNNHSEQAQGDEKKD